MTSWCMEPRSANWTTPASSIPLHECMYPFTYYRTVRLFSVWVDFLIELPCIIIYIFLCESKFHFSKVNTHEWHCWVSVPYLHKKLTNCLPECLYHSEFPPAMYKRSSCFMLSLACASTLKNFYFNHSNQCIVVC